MRRRTVFGQVLRCRAEQMVDGQQLPSHQTGGWLIGDSDGEINMVVDQIHLPILKQQLHIHFGITAQKLRHMRVNHESALPLSAH